MFIIIEKHHYLGYNNNNNSLHTFERNCNYMNQNEVSQVAFGISENTTSYFITNKLDFPRFQRKPTWKEKDNFKMCISVFKGYPIGVVIVNEMTREGKKYLLDGRQRRQALLDMYRDPTKLYTIANILASSG